MFLFRKRPCGGQPCGGLCQSTVVSDVLLPGGRQHSPLPDARRRSGRVPYLNPRSPIYSRGESVSSAISPATIDPPHRGGQSKSSAPSASERGVPRGLDRSSALVSR